MQIDRSEKMYWIALLSVAAAFTLIQTLELLKDIKAARWPTEPGNFSWRIYSSGPRQDPFAGPVIGPLLTRDFSYSYKVNGIQYSSDNKSFGLTFSENFEVLHRGDKDHATVRVYVNPLDPEETVLIPGPKVINICLIALGLFSLFWLLKRIKKTN